MRVSTECPPHLAHDDGARAAWLAVIGALAAAGTLGAETLPAIERYCVVLSRWRAAEAALAREGTVVAAPTSGVAMISPWLSVSRSAAAQLAKLEAELGLVPARRSNAVRAARPLQADGTPAPPTALDRAMDEG